MFVAMRFRVAEAEGDRFLDQAHTALQALAARPGYVDGAVGRATDDPTLWLLTCRWDSIGAYRRALSSYDVKVAAVPLMSTAQDEPTAFEVLADAANRRESDRAADSGWQRR